ncbi:Hpt domain-containing protein [Paucidesulfovibrio longus]|uniref:Hpt domain-containing protein n=1 Tax=Paucidesulfovibrio longus TaxID=889 RepID=UPI0003B342BA|nr:Hpt domain-containing protein [Paucidesulfovibrio longus]
MTIDPMVEEFFAEVNDKYYPQVIEGLELLDSGNVAEGIEILARPIHTIKGVAGFMSGFEPASSFTHKVEDFLKALQAEKIECNEGNLALAGRGVTAIFQVLEQIRTEGALNQQEADEILKLLADAAGGKRKELAPSADCFRLVRQDGYSIIRVTCPRLHLEGHRLALGEQLGKIADGEDAVLDLEEVRTMGSSVWQSITGHAARLQLAAAGMRGSCRATFYAWGFDRYFESYSNLEAYLQRQQARRERSA